jgi:hypothetical protein
VQIRHVVEKGADLGCQQVLRILVMLRGHLPQRQRGGIIDGDR